VASRNQKEVEKKCFGILERVFPMGPGGLREVPEGCLNCSDRTACLREALQTPEGFAVRGEVLDRQGPRGVVGRLRRWSHRKELDRRIQEKQGKKRRWWR
jgi:hypothetical protein